MQPKLSARTRNQLVYAGQPSVAQSKKLAICLEIDIIRTVYGLWNTIDLMCDYKLISECHGKIRTPLPGEPLRSCASSSMSSTLPGREFESLMTLRSRNAHRRLALCSMLTTFAMIASCCGGTCSQPLNAAIIRVRISLPGFEVM